MQAMLNRIRTAFGRGGLEEEDRQPDERLNSVVKRQRGLRGASVQDRLSRQQTDPHAEEATAPLYDTSVYSSRSDSVSEAVPED